MFCTNCGKEIIDTARFCNYCGRPVQPLVPPPPYPAPNMGQPYIPNTPAPAAPAPETNNTAVQPENGTSGAFVENVSEASADPDNFSGNSEENNPEQTAAAANYETAESDNYVSGPAISGTAPEAETISRPTAVNGMYSAEANPYPTPGAIPKSGGSYSGAYSMPMPDTMVNISPEPVTPAPKPERERKYTLGHILLCLASTAIMAITAGIFAGLYFSVV